MKVLEFENHLKTKIATEQKEVIYISKIKVDDGIWYYNYKNIQELFLNKTDGASYHVVQDCDKMSLQMRDKYNINAKIHYINTVAIYDVMQYIINKPIVWEQNGSKGKPPSPPTMNFNYFCDEFEKVNDVELALHNMALIERTPLSSERICNDYVKIGRICGEFDTRTQAGQKQLDRIRKKYQKTKKNVTKKNVTKKNNILDVLDLDFNKKKEITENKLIAIKLEKENNYKEIDDLHLENTNIKIEKSTLELSVKNRSENIKKTQGELATITEKCVTYQNLGEISKETNLENEIDDKSKGSPKVIRAKIKSMLSAIVYEEYGYPLSSEKMNDYMVAAYSKTYAILYDKTSINVAKIFKKQKKKYTKITIIEKLNCLDIYYDIVCEYCKNKKVKLNKSVKDLKIKHKISKEKI